MAQDPYPNDIPKAASIHIKRSTSGDDPLTFAITRFPEDSSIPIRVDLVLKEGGTSGAITLLGHCTHDGTIYYHGTTEEDESLIKTPYIVRIDHGSGMGENSNPLDNSDEPPCDPS